MNERDKFLTEVMGEEWRERGKTYSCMYQIRNSNDFSTWEGFGKLWEWSQKQEWYSELVDRLRLDPKYWLTRFIHPDRFADAVYSYLKEAGR